MKASVQGHTLALITYRISDWKFSAHYCSLLLKHRMTLLGGILGLIQFNPFHFPDKETEGQRSKGKVTLQARLRVPASSLAGLECPHSHHKSLRWSNAISLQILWQRGSGALKT